MADKYADIMPEAVRRVMAREAARHADPKAAHKAARRALHGLSEVYFPHSGVKRTAKALALGDITGVLNAHASTRERMACYAALFAAAEGFIRGRVLDVACGLNPIAFGGRGYEVMGLDIHLGCVEAVNAFAARSGARVRARACDIAEEIPGDEADTALLFKIAPLLERERAGRTYRLLEGLRVRRAVLSFPGATLSGKRVGMKAHYDGMLPALLPPGRRVARVLDTPGEVFYFITRD